MHIYQYSEQLLWQNGDPYCQRSTIAVKDEKKILKKAISNISLIRVTERFAAGTLFLTYNHLRQKGEVVTLLYQYIDAARQSRIISHTMVESGVRKRVEYLR